MASGSWVKSWPARAMPNRWPPCARNSPLAPWPCCRRPSSAGRIWMPVRQNLRASCARAISWAPETGDGPPPAMKKAGISLISARVLATIHQDVLPRHVPRMHRAQKGAHHAELLGGAKAAGGMRLGRRLVFLVKVAAGLGGTRLHRAAQPIGVEWPRQQAVDGHA